MFPELKRPIWQPHFATEVHILKIYLDRSFAEACKKLPTDARDWMCRRLWQAACLKGTMPANIMTFDAGILPSAIFLREGYARLGRENIPDDPGLPLTYTSVNHPAGQYLVLQTFSCWIQMAIQATKWE